MLAGWPRSTLLFDRSRLVRACMGPARQRRLRSGTKSGSLTRSFFDRKARKRDLSSRLSGGDVATCLDSVATCPDNGRQSPVTNPIVPGFDSISEDAFASDDGPETIKARLISLVSLRFGVPSMESSTAAAPPGSAGSGNRSVTCHKPWRDMSRTVTRDSHGGVTPVTDRGGKRVSISPIGAAPRSFGFPPS